MSIYGIGHYWGHLCFTTVLANHTHFTQKIMLFADKTSMNSSTQWRLPWLEWSVVPLWEWKDQLPSKGWEACDAPSCPGQLVSRNAQCVFKWSSKWWAICRLPCNIRCKSRLWHVCYSYIMISFSWFLNNFGFHFMTSSNIHSIVGDIHEQAVFICTAFSKEYILLIFYTGNTNVMLTLYTCNINTFNLIIMWP